MASRHGTNSYSDHVRLIYHHIDRFNLSFDQAAPDQTFHGATELLTPNMLHGLCSHDAVFEEPNLFVGVFVLTYADQALKLSVEKKLALRKDGRFLMSSTDSYSYNISWKEKYKGAYIKRIIRFDNQDDWPGHGTRNHFHWQVESNATERQVMPRPLHTGTEYPHLGEIFELAQHILYTGNIRRAHEDGLKSFRTLSATERLDPALWYPKIKHHLPSVFEYLSACYPAPPTVSDTRKNLKTHPRSAS